MNHKDILSRFRSLFPDYAKSIVLWYPNGKNSIRLRGSYNQEFIFTFNSQKDWKLETRDSFIKRIKNK